MSRVTQSFQNFSAGELSPKMRGRYDIPIYYTGHERVENFISEVQGPARYRTGLKLAESTYQNKVACLIPFTFNDEQSYILELTNERGRIYTNNGLLVGDSNTITGISKAGSAAITFSGVHGMSTGDEIYVSGVLGMTEINDAYYTVTVLSTTVVGITGLDSTGFTTYSSGGTGLEIVHFSHPYLEAELFEVRVAQQADTMYTVHRNHAPRKIVRASASSFTCATFTRTDDPFGSNNYPGAVTFFEQRTWYAGTTNNPQQFWASGSSNFDVMTVGSGATDAFTATLATKQTNVIRWIEGNEDVLIFGANGGNIKFSGGSSGITPTNFQSKPLDFLGAASISPIIKDKRIIFCQQDKRKLRALDFDFETDSYEPTDLTKIADHITIGGVKQMAYQDGRPDIVWSVKDNGELIGLTYDPRENIQGWHRHTTGKTLGDKFLSVAVMPQINTVDQVWTVTERIINGSTKRFVEFFTEIPEYPERIDFFTGDKEADEANYLLALWEKQKEYFHLDCGLTYDGSLVFPTYMDIAAVTGASIQFTCGDTLFQASDIGREIWEKGGFGRAEIIAFTDSQHVNCKIKVDFSSTTRMQATTYYITTNSLTGLDHLEGRTIKVVTDGSTHTDKVVTSGAVTIDYQASVVHAGLGYDGIIKTNNLEAGGMNGTAHGKVKNVHKLDIRFLNTLGASYGEDLYNMQDILFRSTGSLLNRAPELFSGLKEVKFPGNHGKDKHIIIKQIKPLPCTAQFIGVNLTTGGE